LAHFVLLKIKTMPEKITLKQENRIVDLVKDAVRSLVKLFLKKRTISDKRFGPVICKSKFTVPVDYVHAEQIDRFGKKVKGLKTTYYYNDNLTSANFAKATNKLVPGKTYLVKIFPILATVPIEDILAFLRKQKAVLVGGQGLTLVSELQPEFFPKGKWTVSFDEKDALWKDSDGDRRVPLVHANTDGGFKFSLGFFEYGWNEVPCLLCFCDDLGS